MSNEAYRVVSRKLDNGDIVYNVQLPVKILGKVLWWRDRFRSIALYTAHQAEELYLRTERDKVLEKALRQARRRGPTTVLTRDPSTLV